MKTNNEEKAREIADNVAEETDYKRTAAYEAAMQMAEWKDAQRRTPPDDTTEGFVHLVIGEVVCHETEVERQLEQGKAFAECNKTVFDVAMAVAKFYDEQLQLRMDAYKRERKALVENKELRERNDALKRQLAESNKQIMIYSHKLRKYEND